MVLCESKLPLLSLTRSDPLKAIFHFLSIRPVELCHKIRLLNNVLSNKIKSKQVYYLNLVTKHVRYYTKTIYYLFIRKDIIYVVGFLLSASILGDHGDDVYEFRHSK